MFNTTRARLAIVVPASVAVLGFMATAAHADQVPVNATVTVNESLQVLGYPSLQAFGNALPGQTATASQTTFEVVSNHGPGTSQSVKNENGGYHTQIGQPDQIPNSATVITNSTGAHRLVADGSTFLRSIPVGDQNLSEVWSLDIPATASGSLNAQYTVSFISN